MRYEKISVLILALLVACLFLFGSSNGEQKVLIKEVITLPGAPPSNLPYSPGIKVGNMLFLSGTTGTDPKTGELVSDDVAEQTKACMERLKIVLEQAGMDFSDVVRGTVFLADINDYAAMNKVYGSYFKKAPPARACVQAAKLVHNAKVEISMIAIKTE
jgi:2-iminobutanoate/2-iminopropanoate deaminase